MFLWYRTVQAKQARYKSQRNEPNLEINLASMKGFLDDMAHDGSGLIYKDISLLYLDSLTWNFKAAFWEEYKVEIPRTLIKDLNLVSKIASHNGVY
jgi:hypothetical protein